MTALDARPAQDKRFLVLGLQQGFDGLRKPMMSELQPISLIFAFGKADNLDNVDRTNLGGVLIQFVEVGYKPVLL